MSRAINIPMLRRYLLRLIQGRTEFLDTAISSSVIEPERRIKLPPAVFNEGEFEKVGAFSPWREKEVEQLLASGGNWLCKSIVAHTLQNVSISNGFLYKDNASIDLGCSKEHILTPNHRPKERIDSASIVSTWSGNNFFGSLLLDDYPLELLTSDPAQNLRVMGKEYSHDPGYRKLLGLEKTRVTENAHVGQLVVYDDPTISRSKSARYHELRKRLRSSLSIPRVQRKKIVYLKRGFDGEQREIWNVEEFENSLLAANCEIINTGAMSPSEIARQSMGADIIIGIEGSHLSHGIFTMSENGTLLVIQPPDRFAMVYKEFTDCMNMTFAFLVGDAIGPGQFNVNTSKLNHLIETIYSRCRY